MRYLFLLIAVLLLVSSLQAQIVVNLHSNVDRQPVWGPTGYDRVEYYYLPDIETYYNVSQKRYYYFEGGRWIGRSQLPSRYNNYDFYKSYKVVVNDKKPYHNHKMYKDKYFSYKGNHDQKLIRDSRDARYFVIKNHPEHNNWVKQQKHDNGKGKGKSAGNNQKK